jgi:hypothetical protein
LGVILNLEIAMNGMLAWALWGMAASVGGSTLMNVTLRIVVLTWAWLTSFTRCIW